MTRNLVYHLIVCPWFSLLPLFLFQPPFESLGRPYLLPHFLSPFLPPSLLSLTPLQTLTFTPLSSSLMFPLSRLPPPSASPARSPPPPLLPPPLPLSTCSRSLPPSSACSDIAPASARFASQLAVRNRMKSVRSIQKITKAMKMVAASKLRGVQGKTEQSRGMWQPFTALLGDNPTLVAPRTLVITVSTDRGLCGGINSTVVKHSRAVSAISAPSAEESKSVFVILGEKAKLQLQRDSNNTIVMTVADTQKQGINFTQTSMIVDEILKNVEFDTARIIYNRFNSVVAFVPTVSTVLSPETLLKEAAEGGSASQLAEYEIEGEEGQEELFQNLSEFQLASTLYNAQLENACSEQGARMSAMDNSSRNASDMLGRLTLSYNRSRQATITTELIEIISGAAALEG
ncbi:unnamed protein product [Closterium sp. Naga37s-1]|nr:unnamed protein product [Closterium sp. Naga37s-1]